MTLPTFEVHEGDALSYLRDRVPSDSVDTILTDPPYSSLEKHRKTGTTTRLKVSEGSSNVWFPVIENAVLLDHAKEWLRVLKPGRHLYLMCDPETSYDIVPELKAAGWVWGNRLIWNKCLAEKTLVPTSNRGVIMASQLVAGDYVLTPTGAPTLVRAVRKTYRPSVTFRLSDGSGLTVSPDHRMVRSTGEVVEAAHLHDGDELLTGKLAHEGASILPVGSFLSGRAEDIRVRLKAATNECLWCGQEFKNARAASAHGAQFCASAMPAGKVAKVLGWSVKKTRWWLNKRELPASAAAALKLEISDSCRIPGSPVHHGVSHVPLDYQLGRVVGLFAAEGSTSKSYVSFSFHRDEATLVETVARYFRNLGIASSLTKRLGKGAVLNVSSSFAKDLLRYFVTGIAHNKAFTSAVFDAPASFRQGVADGLLDGDGHWDHKGQRMRFVSASASLASYIRIMFDAACPNIVWRKNDGRGAWIVTFDPKNRRKTTVESVTHKTEPEAMIDITVADPEHLFLLANGVVTHNCWIGMGYHYRRKYEDILFFTKAPKGDIKKRRLRDLGMADVLDKPEYRALKGAGYYPTQKPVALLQALIHQSTEPGELVLDPFCGSGSTGEAALTVGCRFLGIDITPEAIRRSTERLSGLSEAPKTQTPAPEPPEEADEAPEPVQAVSATKPKVRVLAAPQGMRPLFGSPKVQA